MKGISGDAEVSIIDSFTDKDQISEYALGSMRTLVGLGIIEGSDKRLRPLNNVLRAESAEIMYRIYNMK
jgi:hypothetical protein